jgi:hypothetical protein
MSIRSRVTTSSFYGMASRTLAVVAVVRQLQKAAAPSRARRRGPTAYCFVTRMFFAFVVSVNPAVWLVNDPLREPNVRAV